MINKNRIQIMLCLCYLPVSFGFSDSSHLDLGRWYGFGDLVSSTLVCIGNSGKQNGIRITSTGNTFYLRSGNKQLPFSVSVGDRQSARPVKPLEPISIPSTSHASLCSFGTPLSLSINVKAKDLYAKPSGNYRGQLLLTVFSE